MVGDWRSRPTVPIVCDWCGVETLVTPAGSTPRFCKATHRMAWHNYRRRYTDDELRAEAARHVELARCLERMAGPEVASGRPSAG